MQDISQRYIIFVMIFKYVDKDLNSRTSINQTSAKRRASFRDFTSSIFMVNNLAGEITPKLAQWRPGFMLGPYISESLIELLTRCLGNLYLVSRNEHKSSAHHCAIIGGFRSRYRPDGSNHLRTIRDWYEWKPTQQIYVRQSRAWILSVPFKF